MIYLVTKRKEFFERIKGIRFSSIENVVDYFSNKKFVGTDTETEGFDPYTKNLLTIQFGDYDNQFIIDCKTVDIQKLKSFLESDKIFIFQNAKFDLRFFLHHRIVIKNVFDTFLAESILTTGIKSARKGLDFLAHKYAGADLNKEIRGDINKFGLTQEVLEYAADDVKYLELIKDKQLKSIREYNLENALTLDNNFVKVLAYIEYCGLYLNKELWEDKISKHEILQNKYIDKLNNFILSSNLTEYIEDQLDLFNDKKKCTINWDSPKQVATLFKQLGINVTVKDKETGKYKDSVESTVLKPQAKDFPILKDYLDYKEESKEISTYGTDFFKYINPISKRVHSNYYQIKNTGRLSSSDPNLQNIPSDPETRKCFEAEKDNLLVGCDYSAQESIVMTNFSKDKNLLEFYGKDLGDLHSWVASLIFKELKGLSLNEIKEKYPYLRQLAKSAGFAIQYGGNGMTIANNLSISIEEGDSVYNKYMEAFPDLKDYFDHIQKETHKRGYIVFNNITNRKSFFDFLDKFKELKETINHQNFWTAYRIEKQKDSDNFNNYLKPLVKDYYYYKGVIDRRALNYPIQGTSADMTKYAACLFYKYLVKNNLLFIVKIVNSIHDEIIAECLENMANTIAKELQKAMLQSANLFCKILGLKAKPEISKYWKH